MAQDNNETCPVCDETYNHFIDNGYRNGWPTEGGDVATVKFEVCTPDDSDYMYVHTEGIAQIMCGDGLAELQKSRKESYNQSDTTTGTITCKNGHEHDVRDMDTVGMDYRCPECHVVVRPHE